MKIEYDKEKRPDVWFLGFILTMKNITYFVSFNVCKKLPWCVIGLDGEKKYFGFKKEISNQSWCIIEFFYFACFLFNFRISKGTLL